MPASSSNGASSSTTPRQRPLNGEEYLASLRDGREVWVHNERVADPTTHPALRNAARMVARLYDAMHDPKRRELLTTKTSAGADGYTHRFFAASHSVGDLVKARDAIAEWARTTYGWMGQSPEEGASLFVALGNVAPSFGHCREQAEAWSKRVSEEALYVHHAIRDAASVLADPRETPIHVERETDSGLVISGATVVPAAAAISFGGFFLKDGVMPARGEEYPLAFVAPMAMKGVRLHYRPNSTVAARLYGNPFDYPLTSRLEENDALLIFDQALIPFENLICYGEFGSDKLAGLRAQFAARASFQESTRLSIKLELIAGLLLRSVDAAGTGGAPEVQAAIGEILSYRNLFWGMSEAQARVPVVLADGTYLPNPDHGLSYRIFSSLAYPRIRDVIERTVGSGHVFLSATASDFMNPETRAYLDRFVRGENGYSALDRVKLTKLLWDALGTDIGARSKVESVGRTTDDMRADVLTAASGNGLAAACKGFAGRCLDEYDLEGWRVKDLHTNVELPPVVSSRRRTTNW